MWARSWVSWQSDRRVHCGDEFRPIDGSYRRRDETCPVRVFGEKMLGLFQGLNDQSAVGFHNSGFRNISPRRTALRTLLLRQNALTQLIAPGNGTLAKSRISGRYILHVDYEAAEQYFATTKLGLERIL
jgi:hypothetical protein